MSQPTDDPWYREGLAFECTRCGNCCTGAPGYVWVDAEEIALLAGSLGMTPDEFGRAYVRQVGGEYSLIEKPNGDCVFWSRTQGCTVYKARPTQCRTWPFWDDNIATPEDWKRTGEGCPGVDRGPIYSIEAIQTAACQTPAGADFD